MECTDMDYLRLKEIYLTCLHLAYELEGSMAKDNDTENAMRKLKTLLDEELKEGS